jgi:hypothetical protein
MTRRGAGVAGVGLALIVACGRPPLHTESSGDGVRVSVQTLGEYKTTVSRIRLTCNGDATWEVVANTRAPQIHRFTLRAGMNPCFPDDVSEPEYRVVLPARCQGVRIQPGARCVLEVWGTDSALSRVQKEIRLPEAMSAKEAP